MAISPTRQDALFTAFGRLVEPGRMKIQCLARTRDLLRAAGKQPRMFGWYVVDVVMDAKGRVVLETPKLKKP